MLVLSGLLDVLPQNCCEKNALGTKEIARSISVYFALPQFLLKTRLVVDRTSD